MSIHRFGPGVAAMATAIFMSTAAYADPFGGFFGRYLYSDGTQERNSRAVAGAAPNMEATAYGIRCSYRYIVIRGERRRYEVCD